MSQKNGFSGRLARRDVDLLNKVAADRRTNSSQLLSTNSSAQPTKKLTV